MTLQEKIEELFTKTEFEVDDHEAFNQFKAELREGRLRAAEKDESGNWQTNTWVKKGILLGFKMGNMVNMSFSGESFQFFDKDTYPLRPMNLDDKVRIVPGGSTIRDGCYVAPGVVCMPPMYINVGAYVDENTMIDSHALVGSLRSSRKARSHLGGGTDRRRSRTRRRESRHHRRRLFDRRQHGRLRRRDRPRKSRACLRRNFDALDSGFRFDQ